MKCQIMFSDKKIRKHITNLSSAELAQRVIKVKQRLILILYVFFFFSKAI